MDKDTFRKAIEDEIRSEFRLHTPIEQKSHIQEISNLIDNIVETEGCKLPPSPSHIQIIDGSLPCVENANFCLSEL